MIGLRHFLLQSTIPFRGRLRYTNAGHLPAFCISDGGSIHLAEGGIVLGVMEEYSV